MQNDNGINGNHYLIDPPTKFRDELNGAFPTSEGSEVCDLIITHYVWLLTNDDVDHMPDQFDELSQVIAAYRLPWPVAEMLCAVYRIGKKGTEVRAWNKVLKFCAIQLRNIHGRAKEADEKLFFDVMRVAHFRLRDMGEIPVLTYGGNGDKLAALKDRYIKHGFVVNSPVAEELLKLYGMSDKEWTQYYNLLNGIEPEPTIEERIEDAILGSTITEVTTNITKAMTHSKVDREVVLTMRVNGVASYVVERSGPVSSTVMHKELYELARKELRTHFEIEEDLAG